MEPIALRRDEALEALDVLAALEDAAAHAMATLTFTLVLTL